MVSCGLSCQTCCVADIEAHECSCLSGRFVDGFQDLPKQFGRVWRSKIFSGFEILLVVLGGSTRHLLKKKLWNGKSRSSTLALKLNYTEFCSGVNKATKDTPRLGLIKWLKLSPRKALRGKLPIRHQGLILRFAVNVDFLFLNKLFGLKIDDKKCNFWCFYLAEKLAFWALLLNERWYAAKIGRWSRFAGCDDGNIH